MHLTSRADLTKYKFPGADLTRVLFPRGANLTRVLSSGVRFGRADLIKGRIVYDSVNTLTSYLTTAGFNS